MTIKPARLSHGVKLARRLRGETTTTLRWIADRVQMGSWAHVLNLPHAKR